MRNVQAKSYDLSEPQFIDVQDDAAYISVNSWVPFCYLGLIGLGPGRAFVTRLMGVISPVNVEKQAVIQAASWTFGSISLAFCITIVSTIFEAIAIEDLRGLLLGCVCETARVEGPRRLLV